MGSEKGVCDVDTRACGFTSTPLYFTTLEGTANHEQTTGANAIYFATATGFRVYLRFTDGRVFTPVAHVCDSDIPAALELLTESDIASITAGPTVPLDSFVEEGLIPLAERRATGKILVSPA